MRMLVLLLLLWVAGCDEDYFRRENCLYYVKECVRHGWAINDCVAGTEKLYDVRCPELRVP